MIALINPSGEIYKDKEVYKTALSIYPNNPDDCVDKLIEENDWIYFIKGEKIISSGKDLTKEQETSLKLLKFK